MSSRFMGVLKIEAVDCSTAFFMGPKSSTEKVYNFS